MIQAGVLMPLIQASAFVGSGDQSLE